MSITNIWNKLSTKVGLKTAGKVGGRAVAIIPGVQFVINPFMSAKAVKDAWTGHEITSMKILDLAGVIPTEIASYIPYAGFAFGLAQIPWSIGVSILESVAMGAKSQNQFRVSPMVYNNQVASSIMRATSKMGALAGTSLASQNRAYNLHRKYGISV